MPRNISLSKIEKPNKPDTFKTLDGGLISAAVEAGELALAVEAGPVGILTWALAKAASPTGRALLAGAKEAAELYLKFDDTKSLDKIEGEVKNAANEAKRIADHLEECGCTKNPKMWLVTIENLPSPVPVAYQARGGRLLHVGGVTELINVNPDPEGEAIIKNGRSYFLDYREQVVVASSPLCVALSPWPLDGLTFSIEEISSNG